MSLSKWWCACAFVALSCSEPAFAAPPANWDGLVQVPSKGADLVYLRPGADFRPYNAVILDPTEVAFHKNWQRELNSSRRGAARITDSDVREAINEAQGKLRSSFEKKFRAAGFQIASAPAENVARVFVGVANVHVTAPEMSTAGRSRVFAEQAGYATLVIEVRDSLSGELLGRAVDQGIAGDTFVMSRDRVSNWSDFERLFDDWAVLSSKGFQKLIASAPR
jgi:hypothetical protein